MKGRARCAHLYLRVVRSLVMAVGQRLHIGMPHNNSASAVMTTTVSEYNI